MNNPSPLMITSMPTAMKAWQEKRNTVARSMEWRFTHEKCPGKAEEALQE